MDLVCVAGLLIGLALVVRADLAEFRIPDAVSLPLIAGGLLCSWWHGAAGSALIGAAVGYLSFVAIEILYRRVRGRDGLGRGDAKLFAAAGAWVGWSGLAPVLLIGAGSALAWALVTGNRDAPLPFGPFLALGLLSVYAVRMSI